MNDKATILKPSNSKGAAIFKKKLDDKKAIQEHLKTGGKISDLKDRYKFVKPLSTSGKFSYVF
jgi:hypothetical protein